MLACDGVHLPLAISTGIGMRYRRYAGTLASLLPCRWLRFRSSTCAKQPGMNTSGRDMVDYDKCWGLLFAQSCGPDTLPPHLTRLP